MKPFFTIAFILASFTSDIKTESFVNQWGDGVAVVQYNAVFNKTNSVKNLARLSDARVFNAWIDTHPKLKEIGRVKSVPTIVLYKDGEEIRRWEAGISMKLDINYKDVQVYVDEVLK